MKNITRYRIRHFMSIANTYLCAIAGIMIILSLFGLICLAIYYTAQTLITWLSTRG